MNSVRNIGDTIMLTSSDKLPDLDDYVSQKICDDLPVDHHVIMSIVHQHAIDVIQDAIDVIQEKIWD